MDLSPRGVVDDVRAEVVDDLWALHAVAADWRRLAEGRGNAFLTPEWYLTWLGHYGDGAQPRVVVTREAGGEVIGILPLVLSGRTLRFGGANVGDRFHPVCAPDREPEVARAAAAALGAAPGRSALVLDNVDEGAPWRLELMGAWPERLAATRIRAAELPYVPLAGATWDSYMAERSRNFRSQVRRKARSLERDHGARFRLAEDPQGLAGDMDRFFELHDARWSSRGGSTSAGARVRAFHTDFAAAALERGWLRLWFLEVGGEAVAVWYGWRIGDRYAYYLAGFDPAWSGASVGLVLLAHTVRSAIEEGAGEYDMLLGDEPYKARFATAERSVETVALTGAFDPRRAVVAAESGARRLARRLPPGLRARTRAAADGVVGRLPGARTR